MEIKTESAKVTESTKCSGGFSQEKKDNLTITGLFSYMKRRNTLKIHNSLFCALGLFVFLQEDMNLTIAQNDIEMYTKIRSKSAKVRNHRESWVIPTMFMQTKMMKHLFSTRGSERDTVCHLFSWVLKPLGWGTLCKEKRSLRMY